jgi:hypothetical protein
LVGLRARRTNAYFDNFVASGDVSSVSTSTPTSTPTPIAVVQNPNQPNTFSDDFSSNTGAWQYLGSAYRDAGNQCIVLTTDSYSEGGAVFFKTPIQGSFTANFRYKAGEGNWGADGFTLFFYKQKYSNLDDGGSLAFSAMDGAAHQLVPGYGVEFDCWQNIPEDFQQFAGGQQNPSGDPSSHHIALIKDFAGNYLAYVDDTRVDDNAWHQVTVQVQGSSVSVSVDNGLVLQWTGEINRTFDCFGFSGGTGCATGWQLIDDFSINSKDLHTASLTTNCISATAQQIFNVYAISGNLISDGIGILGAPIYVSYSVTGGESWQDLTLVYTDSDGSYSAMWLPTVTGNYQLKTVYRGDENFLGTSNIISFSIQSSTNQNVFSITSNSTITGLSFNPNSRQLAFNVSGDSGTRGYAYVFTPKSLLRDTVDINVQLDGNQINYTVQSQNDGSLLYLEYHHSTHIVKVNLGSAVSIVTGKSASQFDVSNFIFMIVIAAIAIISGVLIVGLRALKKNLLITKKSEEERNN